MASFSAFSLSCHQSISRAKAMEIPTAIKPNGLEAMATVRASKEVTANHTTRASEINAVTAA